MKVKFVHLNCFVFLGLIISFFNVKSQNYNSQAVFIQEQYEAGGYQNDSLFNLAEQLYKQMLQKDSLDYEANYNIGTLYFNRAVFIGNSIKVSLDSLPKEEREKIISEVNFYLLKSKPHLKIWNRVHDNFITK